jgi:hypothetical protein
MGCYYKKQRDTMSEQKSKDSEEFQDSSKKKKQREIDSVYYLLYDDAVTLNEKREILEKLDQAVAESSDLKKPDAPEFIPRKKGSRFPILVNLCSIIITGLIIFLTFVYFGTRRENLLLEASTYFTAESAIIEEFKRESEEKLRKKDEKINQIRDQIDKLDYEQKVLRQNFEAALKIKEEELKRVMDEEINREKRRIEASGASIAVLEEKISEFASKKIIEYARELEEYKREMEAKLQKKEKEILEEREQTTMLLVAAERERQQLVEETKKHEEELRAEYEKEKGIFIEKATLAEQRFAALSKLRQQEYLISDQVVSSYSTVQDKIEASNFQGATDELNKLRELILDESLDSVPSVAKRRKVDLFIIDSLNEMIQSKSAVLDNDSIAKNTELLFTVRDTMISAESLFEQGKHDEAKRLYYKAIEDILTLADESAFLEKHEDESVENLPILSGGEEVLTKEEDILNAIERYKEVAPLLSKGNHGIIVAALDIIQESLEHQEEKIILEEELVTKQEQIEKSQEEKIILVSKNDAKIETLQTDEVSIRESLVDNETDSRSIVEPSQSTVNYTQSNFLGTLSYISSDFVVIEPLVDIQIEKGNVVLIRRRLTSGMKIDVAQCIIDDVIEGKITASIDIILLDDNTPIVSDLVYTAILTNK